MSNSLGCWSGGVFSSHAKSWLASAKYPSIPPTSTVFTACFRIFPPQGFLLSSIFKNYDTWQLLTIVLIILIFRLLTLMVLSSTTRLSSTDYIYFVVVCVGSYCSLCECVCVSFLIDDFFGHNLNRFCLRNYVFYGSGRLFLFFSRRLFR